MPRPGPRFETGSRPMRADHRSQGRGSRAEPVGGLADRCPRRAAHPVARRQERPTLPLLRLRCPDHRGRNGGAQGWRLGAMEIENAVIQDPSRRARQPGKVARPSGHNRHASRASQKNACSRRRLAAALNRQRASERTPCEALSRGSSSATDTITHQDAPRRAMGRQLVSHIGHPERHRYRAERRRVDFKRRGVGTKLVLPGLAQQNHSSRGDPALIKAIARGRAWFEELATGRARIAARAGQARRHQPALYPPPCQPRLFEPGAGRGDPAGPATAALTATRLTELDLPLDWTEQHRLLKLDRKLGPI